MNGMTVDKRLVTPTTRHGGATNEASPRQTKCNERERERERERESERERKRPTYRKRR
jgi:hypothetical protein